MEVSPPLRLLGLYREKFKAVGYEFGGSIINVLRCRASQACQVRFCAARPASGRMYWGYKQTCQKRQRGENHLVKSPIPPDTH
jgi:hypothetical protein